MLDNLDSGFCVVCGNGSGYRYRPWWRPALMSCEEPRRSMEDGVEESGGFSTRLLKQCL
jgi:hypothetical protein